jgi:hypothetical protein
MDYLRQRLTKENELLKDENAKLREAALRNDPAAAAKKIPLSSLWPSLLAG